VRTAWARRGARAPVAGHLALAGWCAALMLATASRLAVPVAAAPPPEPLSTVVIHDPGLGLGLGYTVSSQGPPDWAAFGADTPDPALTSETVPARAQSIPAYTRVWQADGGRNRVQDVLVHFRDTAQAEEFLHAVRQALASGAVVSSDAVAGVPGARHVTYLGAAGHDGVGQAITMRAGPYVALLSFFTRAAGNGGPISPADAEEVARTQRAALAAAPGGTAGSTTAAKPGKGVPIAAVVLVVAVLAVAVATPLLLRRRRSATVPAGTAAVPPAVHSDGGGGAVDDRRERRG
jgi:hypothetical protein